MTAWVGLAVLLYVMAPAPPRARIIDGGAPPEIVAQFSQRLRTEGYEVVQERWGHGTPISALVYARDLPSAEKLAHLFRDGQARLLRWESPFTIIVVLGQSAAVDAPVPPPPSQKPTIRFLAGVGFLSPLLGKDLTVSSLGGGQRTTRAAPLLRGSFGMSLPHPLDAWLDLQAEAFVYSGVDHSFVGPAARIETRIWGTNVSSIALTAEAGAAFNTQEALPGSFQTAPMWGGGGTITQSIAGPWKGALSITYVSMSPRYERPPKVFQVSSSRLALSGPQVSLRISWRPAFNGLPSSR